MSFSCFGSFFITNCSSSIRKNKRNQKSGDSITFNNCKGLLEGDPNAIISGSVKVKAGSNQNSNSYNYDKFTVLDGDGDKTTVTGYLNVSNNSNDTEGSVATDYLKITFTEKVNNQVKDYEYGLGLVEN